MPPQSIFSSSLRAFFVTLFGVVGFAFGFVLLLLIISLFSGTATTEPELIYTPTIVANAQGKRKVLSSSAPVILKINIDGIVGTESLNKETIERQLVESREGTLNDDRVKAVLLYVNSPGGSVFDADGIFRAIKTYKEQYKVPVYAYADGLCASGGLYIAAAADQIFASDISMIGSVGVITPPFLNLSQLIDKIGVQALTLYAGKDKDMLNPLRPWKPDESETMQDLINHYYQEFVNLIVTQRPVDRDKLVNDYGAKVFNSKQAQEYGFINKSDGNLRETIKLLAQKIGIEDDYYQVVELHKAWYSSFLNSKWTLFQGKIVHEIQLSSDLDPRLNNQLLYLYRP